MLDALISFNPFTETGTQLEVVDDKTTFPCSCEEVLLLHPEMTNKCVVSDFLHDFEGVNLNIPGCELDVALDETLDRASLEKHHHFYCIFTGIRHYLSSLNVPHQMEPLTAAQVQG